MAAIRSPEMMTGMARRLHPHQRLEGGHATALGGLDVFRLYLQNAGVGVFQHWEHGVHTEGHDHRGIDIPPPDEQHADEHQAGNGLEDGENGDDDARQPPRIRERRMPNTSPAAKPMTTEISTYIVCSPMARRGRRRSPGSASSFESPHRFSATQRATLVLVTIPAMVSSAFSTTT